MIGHDVEDDAHVAGAELGGDPTQGRLVAEVGVEARVVGDVVAMRAVAAGHQRGRQVGLGDAERVQVADHARTSAKVNRELSCRR